MAFIYHQKIEFELRSIRINYDLIFLNIINEENKNRNKFVDERKHYLVIDKKDRSRFKYNYRYKK